VKLLYTIFIIFIVYYSIRLLLRLLAPFLLQSFMKRMQKKYQPPTQQQNNRKEGDVTVEKVPKNKQSNIDVGEYVDFEEMDE